jgi:vacuolar-type H+-ATPase subunit C/Vma6
VSPVWDDLNARARGLRTHLLDRSRLEALAREPDLACLAEGLRQDGVVSGESTGPVRSTDLELAIRRWAAGLLRILARWAGKRGEALPFVFEDEDRRSIRAMLRGVAQHAPAEARLAGLIPTPALPERALEELAHAPTAAAVVGHLTAWRHPFAADLAGAVGAAQPDLYRIEQLLARVVAAHARRAGRKAHDTLLATYVADTVDLENAVTAITLAMESTDVVPVELFLPGGRQLGITAFEEAIATHEPGAAGRRIARDFAESPYRGVILHGARAPAGLEDEILRSRLRVTARQVRLAPLGPIAVMHFALGLRAQVIDLQRIVWTVALQAPRSEVSANLTTAAT